MKMSKPMVLALVCGTFSVAAQAGDIEYSAKLRGAVLSQSKDGVRTGVNAGFNVSIPLREKSRVNVELGYRYLAGKGYNHPVDTTSGAVVDDNSPTASSVNFQKLTVGGFALRSTYSQDFWIDGFSWHAGVEVAKLKTRMDAIGDYRNASAVQLGSWATNPEQSGVTFAPVAGIQYNFNEAGALEFNLMLSSYKQVTLGTQTNAAIAGYGRVTPIVGSKTTTALTLELGYTFRF